MGTPATFDVIPFNLISKLSSSAQASVNNSKSMIGGIKPFAGKIESTLSTELWELIQVQDKQKLVVSTTNAGGVLELLNRLIRNVEDKITDNGGKWLTGTVGFYRIENLSYETYGDEAETHLFCDSERYFY